MQTKLSSNATTFLCRCHSPEHQLTIVTDQYDDKDYFIYAYIHLKPLPFWQRLRNAVKYIFGHRSNYGDFEEFVFNEEDADTFQKIVDYMKLVKEKEGRHKTIT